MTPSTTPIPPENFICPLTLRIMEHPYQHKITKHTFEKAELFRWMFIFGKSTCPLTRQIIVPSDFQDNRILKEEIKEWREQQIFYEDKDQETRCQILENGENQIMDMGKVEDDDVFVNSILESRRLIEERLSVSIDSKLLGVRDRVLQLRQQRLLKSL